MINVNALARLQRATVSVCILWFGAQQGWSYGDGCTFHGLLTAGKLQQLTIEQLYGEFYAILKMFFDDFKSIKLVPSR